MEAKITMILVVKLCEEILQMFQGGAILITIQLISLAFSKIGKKISVITENPVRLPRPSVYTINALKTSV